MKNITGKYTGNRKLMKWKLSSFFLERNLPINLYNFIKLTVLTYTYWSTLFFNYSVFN